MKRKIRNLIFRTRLLSMVVPVIRIKIFFDYNINNLKKSVTWLLSSREFTNFLYEITALNRNQMVGAISSITNEPITEVEKYFTEIENNEQFRIDSKPAEYFYRGFLGLTTKNNPIIESKR